MTSNIGFTDINIGFSKINNNTILSKLKDYFSLPFINRIDNVIIFNKLTMENVKVISNNKLDILKNKYNRKNIKLRISKELVNDIIKESNYEEFGARKIDKIIKDNIENQIIENVIEGKNNILIKSIFEKSSV